MWRPGKAVVPHRHEEPASYRPTTTARKHGPLQSRTGRQIRDVDRGYALLWSRLRRHCLILIDARFSSCSPRSIQQTNLRPDDLLLLRHLVISVPPEGGSRSQLGVRTAPRPRLSLRKPTTSVRLSPSYYRSMRSVLRRRERRSTGMLAASTTRFSMPAAVSRRCNQNPSYPAS